MAAAMKIVFSSGRPAHVVLPANLLADRGLDVTIYTAAYRSRFRGLTPEVRLRWVPQFVSGFHFLTGVQLPRPLQRIDTATYDRLVSLRMETCDLFWGWASGALSSGRTAQRRGAKFLLDRACPHVDTQQALLQIEAERLGVPYEAEPDWFRQRQLAEYDEADIVLVPSEYSRRSFPSHLQAKLMVAPLFGRAPAGFAEVATQTRASGSPFTFGMVGAQPLRKGFLYLLQAWEKLNLPNARLLLRTDASLGEFPALRTLLQRLPNVELVGYVKNMSEFYRRCDAFVFPTVDDGFGMALMEAIAHRVPAITTDHCGAAELFTTGKDLLVVPAQDTEVLAAAMERVYGSAELRDRMRGNALERLHEIEDDGSYHLYAEALDRVLELRGYPVDVSY